MDNVKIFAPKIGYSVEINGFILINNHKEKLEAVLNHKKFKEFLKAIEETYEMGETIIVYDDGNLCCCEYCIDLDYYDYNNAYELLKNNRLEIR